MCIDEVDGCVELLFVVVVGWVWWFGFVFVVGLLISFVVIVCVGVVVLVGFVVMGLMDDGWCVFG